MFVPFRALVFVRSVVVAPTVDDMTGCNYCLVTLELIPY